VEKNTGLSGAGIVGGGPPCYFLLLFFSPPLPIVLSKNSSSRLSPQEWRTEGNPYPKTLFSLLLPPLFPFSSSWDIATRAINTPAFVATYLAAVKEITGTGGLFFFPLFLPPFGDEEERKG